MLLIGPKTYFSVSHHHARELSQVKETMTPSSGYLDNESGTSFNYPTISPTIEQDEDSITGNTIINEAVSYSSFSRKFDVLPDIFGKKAFVKYPSNDIRNESVLRYSSIRSRAAIDSIVKVWDPLYLAQRNRELSHTTCTELYQWVWGSSSKQHHIIYNVNLVEYSLELLEYAILISTMILAKDLHFWCIIWELENWSYHHASRSPFHMAPIN